MARVFGEKFNRNGLLKNMEYTKWRRFLAWVGLLHLVGYVALIVSLFYYAHQFINTNL